MHRVLVPLVTMVIACTIASYASAFEPAAPPPAELWNACNHPTAVAAAAVPDASSYHAAPGALAMVRVSVDATGKVTAETIERTAGDQSLDAMALAAARQSTYVPAAQTCKSLAGDVDLAIPLGSDAGRCYHEAAPANLEQPDPLFGQLQKRQYTAVADVYVDSAGKVRDTAIVQSSANANLDKAVLEAARRSTFKPRVFACSPSSGVFEYRATIMPAS